MRPIRFFVKTQEYNILSIHSSLISFKTNIEQKEGEKSKMKNAVRKQPDRKVKRKRKNMEEPTVDVKILIETWMRSQDISGFPNLTIQILGQLDLDSLINCRQVSMTFKNFLDKKYGSDFWIERLRQVIKDYRLAMPDKTKRCFTWTIFLKMVPKIDIDNIIKLSKSIKQSEEDGILKFPSDFFKMVEMEKRKQ